MRILSIIAFCFLGLSLSAQTGKPNFFSLNVGFNYPSGEYKEIKLQDTLPPASAQQGYYGSMEFGVYFTKHLGLGFNLGAFYNEINEDEFKNRIMNDLAEDFQNDPSGPAEAYVNTSEWINVYAMAGPYLTFSLFDRAFIDFKLLAGAMSTNEPLLKIKVDHAGQVYLTENEEADAIGLAFNYGMHLRIDLVSKLGLRLNVEGFSSQQQLESSIKEGSWGDYNTSEREFQKNVTAFNVGAGLVLTFD